MCRIWAFLYNLLSVIILIMIYNGYEILPLNEKLLYKFRKTGQSSEIYFARYLFN